MYKQFHPIVRERERERERERGKTIAARVQMRKDSLIVSLKGLGDKAN
jgi:hypothetical protein